MSASLSYRSPQAVERRDSRVRLAMGMVLNTVSVALAAVSVHFGYIVAASYPRTIGVEFGPLALIVLDAVVLVVQTFVLLPIVLLACRRPLRSRTSRQLLAWPAWLAPILSLAGAVAAITYMNAHPRRPGGGV